MKASTRSVLLALCEGAKTITAIREAVKTFPLSQRPGYARDTLRALTALGWVATDGPLVVRYGLRDRQIWWITKAGVRALNDPNGLLQAARGGGGA